MTSSRFTYLCLLGVLALSLPGRLVWSADLSMISDFGRPDLPQEKLGLAPTGTSTVGVEQIGSLNKANIQQAQGSRNNTQVWQTGAELEAALLQYGANNEVRLIQGNARNRVELTQDGLTNRLAMIQSGNNNSVSGSQVGDGNQVVIVQPGSAAFSFVQQGNMNQILADMPTGTAVHVDQIGNNLSFTLTPAN